MSVILHGYGCLVAQLWGKCSALVDERRSSTTGGRLAPLLGPGNASGTIHIQRANRPINRATHWYAKKLHYNVALLVDIAFGSKLAHSISRCVAELLETQAPLYWDEFYRLHGAAFFKDRHYLHREFPELLDGPLTLLEVIPICLVVLLVVELTFCKQSFQA